MTQIAPIPVERTGNGGWRRNALWLLGAFLLAVWAMYVPYREALREYERTRLSYPIDVAPGQWADYAGSRWRLLGVDTAMTGSALSGQRPDAAVLVVHFEVVAGRSALVETLDRCQGSLSDRSGRRWVNMPLLIGRSRYPQPRSCGSDGAGGKVEALPGRPFRFVHAYQIPSAQAQSLHALRAEIVMPSKDDTGIKTPPGTYLRFAF